MNFSRKRFYYSVAVVSKYNTVKIFLCSFKYFNCIPSKISDLVIRKVTASIKDKASCKINVSSESVLERQWILAGKVETEESCYGYTTGLTTLNQCFEVYIIKSIYRPHHNIPAISLWCGTFVDRKSCDKIRFPRLEACYLFEDEDGECEEVDFSIYPSIQTENFHDSKKINRLPQNIGKTRYDVKLIHISSGYKI